MGAPPNSAAAASYANLLKPIDTPLVFSGFSEDAVRSSAQQFASCRNRAGDGCRSVSNEKQPEPIEPGSAVSAILVRGDMNIAATCTVTYIDATPAGLRASAPAVGQRRNADDEGARAGYAALAA